jgi:biotin carboxyl carrier protein
MKLEIEIDGQTREVAIEAAESPGAWRVLLDGEPVEADACLLRTGVLSLILDGRSYRVVLDAGQADPALYLGPHRVPYTVEDPRSLRFRRRHAGAEGPVVIKASMPGRVVRVLVEKGQTVAAHQGVIVIEAMKMQNELKSPKEGRVADLRAAPGSTVAAGDVLAVVE